MWVLGPNRKLCEKKKDMGREREKKKEAEAKLRENEKGKGDSAMSGRRIKGRKDVGGKGPIKEEQESLTFPRG